MKLGLIGTGIIGEAMIKGLYRVGKFEGSSMVSLRTAERSSKLAAEFPLVAVAKDNQEIVDFADLLILAVLPEQCESVMQGLNFKEGQTILSIVSSITLKSLGDWGAPVTKIYRGIPLPPIEFGLGPFPICPPAPELDSLLNSVGTVVSLTNEDQFLSIAVGSAMMAMFYEVVSTTAGYMEKEGLPASESALYASSMMYALADSTMRVNHEGLHQMSEDCLTPGGLNEQVLHGLRGRNWYTELEGEMDRIRDRLSKY
ncbi:MAG: NAD(P)-binding domain-containing protein [Anaerolineae bacterium]